MKYVCFKHQWTAISVCPLCQTLTTVGDCFKEPVTALAWQGAQEFVQMGEIFKRSGLSKTRIRRFVGAMQSPACREYLRLHYPHWYRQFTYLAQHPEWMP